MPHFPSQLPHRVLLCNPFFRLSYVDTLAAAVSRFRSLPANHYFLTVIAILTTVYCFVRFYATHPHRSLTPETRI